MRANDFTTAPTESCPHCGGPMFHEMLMMEKKDACYYKVKASAKVWPSAYASGRLVQCRKKGAANYGNKSESIDEAVNPAQQAAIAIAKKKSGKYNKDGKRIHEDTDKQQAIRRIQKMLNKKYHANLDIDGVLGPLTLQSINKFIPNAKLALADDPDKTTAVQGKNAKESDVSEASETKCPPATQDIDLNLKNRQEAINKYGYGPLNPDEPNQKFWMKKVDEWNLDSPDEAKQSLCGNCAAFDQRANTLDCIAQGIGSELGADDPTIDAGDLGYCRFLKFKCASRRTCDAWVTGGPLTDKQDVAEGERSMSRAAKGNEKYGKDGMKALAKAGREGASDEKLDKIRHKHDTYNEEWSKKYKSSINCSHPKGFSQKAHCAGKKKHNESIEMEMTCPDCGMCETHIGDQNLHEACWKGYHKEGNKELFGKTVPNCVQNEDISQDETSQPNVLDLLQSWRNRVPAQYAWHLTKTFGDPHDVTNDLIIWHDKDGFKRIEIKDEYVMHTSPTPHYDYCYSYIDLKVPHKLSAYLADCSESILIDHLKNEVGARCASLAANAVTLNFVMDVIAGRAQPSRDEYEQRIMDMHHDFENKKIFTIQWWPDQSHDTDPANPYYNQQRKSKSDITEDKRIARKAGQPANSKKHSDLYTDENPRGTIKGLKFATVEDARASVGKIRSSGRSHAHKVQAAVAMEQRARAAGKASAAAVYRTYINSVKKTTEEHHEETTMTENQDELARILELGTGLSTQARAELHEEFDLIESIIEGVAEHNGVDTDVIWEDLESLTDDELYVFAVTTPIMESEAWQKANKRDKTDGMSQKAVNAYRREHPGSKLKTAVTTKPSKLKKGSKASKRRKSYCSRSRGQMKMHSISCAKTPDKAICKARRRWNC